MKKVVLFLLCAIAFSSCMSTRTTVGTYREGQKDGANTYTYAKGKQCYLFWGLVPLGRTNVATPPHGNCQVRTAYKFLDAFLSAITGGIFAMQTITVKAVAVGNDASQGNNSGGQSLTSTTATPTPTPALE